MSEYIGILGTTQEYSGLSKNISGNLGMLPEDSQNTKGDIEIPMGTWEYLGTSMNALHTQECPGIFGNSKVYTRIPRNTLELMKSNIATPPLWDRNKFSKRKRCWEMTSPSCPGPMQNTFTLPWR